MTGLRGAGLVLQINGEHDLAVSRNGSIEFSGTFFVGTSFSVTVAAQPTAPSQTCSVSPEEVSVDADGASVEVTCTTNRYKVGGRVSGLAGSGLTLKNNGGASLAIAADGSFSFPDSVASGETFTVTAASQPTNPAQTCTVSGGSGTVVAGDVTSVTIDCATNLYAIGGAVDGLAGTGLVLTSGTGDELTVNANGSFAFPTTVRSETLFAVGVKTQPAAPAQTCTVSAGTGSVSASDVTTVSVHCVTNSYKVGGTVLGLTGSGLVLQNRLGDDLPISEDGSFEFTTGIKSGETYAVSVLAQPGSPSQTCSVNQASGSVASSAITNVSVTCSVNHYAVGGSVTGLLGSGLELTNGDDSITLDENGSFTFPTSVASGATFSVAIAEQPSSPLQSCQLAGETGTVAAGPITSIVVNCTTSELVVGGSITNLAGSGLTLSLNGGDPVGFNANGPFAFPNPLESGATYEVAVVDQPENPAQTCTLTESDGVVGNVPVTSVALACVTNTYAIEGHVDGLLGGGLVLQNNGDDIVAVTADGHFSFDVPVASGQSYDVTVKTQPTEPWQTCVVTDGAGTVDAEDIMHVMVDCTTARRTVAGTVSGLAGTVVLRNNGVDALALSSNGQFVFPNSVESGQPYSVTVHTQPAVPSQTCSVAQGTGSIENDDIDNVVVTCVTNTFSVGGSVSGLSGAGLVLRNNAGDDLPVSGSGTFTFGTLVQSGQAYSVSVLSQPSSPTQTCSVTGASGTVGGADVSSISVNCATNQYSIGGSVSGLSGTGLVLQNNLANNLSISGSGGYAFATPVASGGSYSVTVQAQPTSPWQTCSVGAGASGVVTNAAISSANVTCTTNSYPIQVKVTGLSGGGLVLQDNLADNLGIASNGTYSFATAVASGAPYSVSVLTQPSNPWQTCSVTSGSGVVAGGPVTIDIACSRNEYMIMGTISGLVGTVVLRNNGGDDLTVSANGHIMFDTGVPSGDGYNVTVHTQPSAYNTCAVTNGTGTVTNANIANVTVTCKPKILFIDDDFGLNGQSTWLSALTAAGYNYDVETLAVGGNPTTNLGLYYLVIWSIGDRAYSNLTAQNVTTLTNYLNLGGRSLLYAGGHALYEEPGAATFVANYLGLVDWSYNMPTKNGAADGTATGLGALAGQSYSWNIWSGGEYQNMLSAARVGNATTSSLLRLDNVNVYNILPNALELITLNQTSSFKAMFWGLDLNHVVAPQRQQLLNNCLSRLH